MSERENNEEIYLSPESVSSRIKSLNEEIRSRMRLDEGRDEEMEGCSVHERTARRYKESLSRRGVEEDVNRPSVVVNIPNNTPNVVNTPIVVNTPVKEVRNSRRTSSNQSSTGSISIDSRLGTRFYKERGIINNVDSDVSGNVIKSQPAASKPTIYQPINQQPTSQSIQSTNHSNQQGKVRDLVQDYSMKIPKKNPFKKGTTSSFPSVTTNPFFIKKKEEPVAPLKTPSVKDDLSILSHNSNTASHNPVVRPIILNPINVLYSPKHPPLAPRESTPSPSSRRIFNKTLVFLNSYYGPGEELTQDIKFTIVNTIYNFNKDVEDTIYYLRVESNTSWIIRKTLSQLRQFLKSRVLDESYNPFDKKVRDNVILTILNTVGKRPKETSPTGTCTTGDLQHFILSNISKDKITEKRSNFLLMGSPALEPYNFRLVGQALVCYDKNNRVYKIFLLKGCSVEAQDEYSFRVSSCESSVLLYSSCETERDSWMEDIREFIRCME